MAITTQHWVLKRSEYTATFRRTGSTIMLVIAVNGRTIAMARLTPAAARAEWLRLEREGFVLVN